MPEETIWKGTSSHWKNAKVYALTLIALAVAAWLHYGQAWTPWVYAAPVALAVWSLCCWLVLKTTSYELTNERLVTMRGILTKVTDTLELYRVRDMQTVQPLLLRFLRLQNVHLITADATTEALVLDYLPAHLQIGEKLRQAVEICREKKRVRALDVVTDDAGDHHGDSMPPLA